MLVSISLVYYGTLQVVLDTKEQRVRVLKGLVWDFFKEVFFYQLILYSSIQAKREEHNLLETTVINRKKTIELYFCKVVYEWPQICLNRKVYGYNNTSMVDLHSSASKNLSLSSSLAIIFFPCLKAVVSTSSNLQNKIQKLSCFHVFIRYLHN